MRHELGKITYYNDATADKWTAFARCSCSAEVGTSMRHHSQTSAKHEIEARHRKHVKSSG